MNEVEEEEDEVLSDYSERELTSNDSYSLELEEVDNIEEEEEEDNLSNADSVVEVSDEDEEAANFKAAFKEVSFKFTQFNALLRFQVVNDSLYDSSSGKVAIWICTCTSFTVLCIQLIHAKSIWLLCPK